MPRSLAVRAAARACDETRVPAIILLNALDTHASAHGTPEVLVHASLRRMAAEGLTFVSRWRHVDISPSV